MKQTNLSIKDALQERRWFPEDCQDGDSFAVRQHTGLWRCAILVNGEWIDENCRAINKNSVSHWARLEL